jgi:hypothetical protein
MRDWIVILIVLLVPAGCVWRLNRTGILIGAVLAWLAGVLFDVVTTNPDPEAGPLRDLWLRYGWAATLCYAMLLFLVKWGYRKVRPPTATPPH